MSRFTFDLVVVGSGFASSFFLKKYLEKAPASARVLVLERGHLFSHTDRVLEKRKEEFKPNLNESSESSFKNATNNKHWEFTNGFGGSSNCWHGCTPRFLPSDFRMKSLYGIAEDWPIQYDELEPYYTEVEEIMSISGSENPPYPKSKPYPQPPHIFSTVDHVLHEKYGNLYVNAPTARARVAKNGRGACCVSSVCSVCPVNAKFTVENGIKEVYSDPRIEFLYGAQVQSLDLSSDSVKKLSYIKDGKEAHVFSEVFALGANAIFNAHILLNSGDSNAFTGKGIGEQISLNALVDLDNLACVGASTKVNANGYMLYDGEHRKEYAACLIEADNAPYIRYEKGKWRNQAKFRMIFEDLPSDNNFVTTSSDISKPEVHFSGISEYSKKGIENMKKKLPEILSCLPVEKITYTDLNPTESHILGSTRMSHSAASGVVDKNLVHHQYRNLFVLGSGSYTTYTPANPTLTLSALSLHAANNSF